MGAAGSSRGRKLFQLLLRCVPEGLPPLGVLCGGVPGLWPPLWLPGFPGRAGSLAASKAPLSTRAFVRSPCP